MAATIATIAITETNGMTRIRLDAWAMFLKSDQPQ